MLRGPVFFPVNPRLSRGGSYAAVLRSVLRGVFPAIFHKVQETAAAKAEDIQPEKTADTSAISAENSFPENTEAAAEKEKTVIVDMNKSPEDMTVDELQQAILAQMAGNGPVTDQMKKTVYDNIWHDSLVNWLKSFH